MIGSNAFNYINVLDKAADAGWVRQAVLSNNVANKDTPNYKRKDVQFESYLMTAMSGGGTLDEHVAGVDLESLNSTTYTDSASLSYRMDGNNVDPDTEASELAKNHIRYNYLTDSINEEFSRIKIALSKS